MASVIPFIAILAPLLGSVLIAVFGRERAERSVNISIAALWCSMLGSLITFTMVVQAGSMRVTLGSGPLGMFAYILHVDRLAAVMMVLISIVSLVIHVYSQRYMTGDEGYVRFFALLGALTCVLLSLVSSGNMWWLFVNWHLITWLLTALVSFHKASLPAKQAGRRTFGVQLLGDIAFAVALAVLYIAYGTMDLNELFRLVQTGTPRMFWLGEEAAVDVSTLATLALVLAIMTKSAQFPFHIWLIGTIEAPTPVSALMHAGIVNAGGFLVNRLAPLFALSPISLHVLFIVGGISALIGATAMLTQSSVKRTLVYSTMGQMGYMVMECGLGAFALAVFHLCAHGLFKATLFLNSGSNIHKARTDFKLPSPARTEAICSFSAMIWTTGLAVTLILPLVILLIAHGVVSIPLQDVQGAVIFLFFGWVTASQVMFSLYRLQTVASWKVPLTMLAALAVIGLTYLWAGEAFTHLLYPSPGEAAAYFHAAEWNRSLFDAFVIFSAILIVAVWVVIYGENRGVQLFVPKWVNQLRVRAYVSFLHGLYIEDFIHLLRRTMARR